MIISKRDLKHYIQEDAKRNCSNIGFWHYIISLLCGFESAYIVSYLKLLRYCEYHFNNKENLYHKLMYYFYYIRLRRKGLKLGIYIPINTCGYGLRIRHITGGVYINAKKVGNYCGFNGGTLLGNKNSQDDRPTLNDHVSLGPGAKVIGNVTIGNYVFVAANAVVTKDVPDNTVVAGIPAKPIEKSK